MDKFLLLKIPQWAIGEACCLCSQPTTASDALIQDNVPGGANAPIHVNCFNTYTTEVAAADSVAA